MNKEYTHLPVNWIDGMKISKNHFIQSDNYTQSSSIDLRNNFLNDYNFGLQADISVVENSIDLIAEESIGKIEVHLKSCNAITRGGARILIHNAKNLNAVCTTTENNSSIDIKEWNLIVAVNPFERMATGVPDYNENPPRHPFTEPTYQLAVIPCSQTNYDLLQYQLVIGKIINIGGILTLSRSYIPPCSSLLSHPELIKTYESFAGILQNLCNISLKLIRKIYEKNKPSSISKNYKQLSEIILNFNSYNYFKLRNTIPYQAPIFLLETFSILANSILTSIYSLPLEEKEELMKYTFEWSEITPGDFENLLLTATKIKYDHYDLFASLEVINKVLKTLQFIWTRLDSLEFIGQRKENMVVTKEVVGQQVEQPKKRWSILD